MQQCRSQGSCLRFKRPGRGRSNVGYARSDVVVMGTASDPRSDAELLRASSWDSEAFGILYDRYAAALLAYFHRRTACAQSAADLTAETFAAAFVARRRYVAAGAPVAAWLFGIARHKLFDANRAQRIDARARRRLRMERVVLDDEELRRVEELADMALLRGEVQDALAALAPESAEAVRLRVVNELPYAEVARRIGCSEGAARVRVARALTRLAERLEASS